MLYGPKLVEAPGEARSNFEVINDLLRRLGSDDRLDAHDRPRDGRRDVPPRAVYGELDEIEKTAFVDREQPEDAARFANGFAWPDGKFRFEPNWQDVADKKDYLWTCDPSELPRFADWWDVNEPTSGEHPFRLATSPSRSFLNSSFSETAGSQKRQPTPTVFVRSDDAAPLGIADGDAVVLGNRRGEVALTAKSLRRPAARGSDRRGRPSQQGARQRQGHQHADRLRPDQALRRRCFPRRSRVDAEGLGRPPVSPAPFALTGTSVLDKPGDILWTKLPAGRLSPKPKFASKHTGLKLTLR